MPPRSTVPPPLYECHQNGCIEHLQHSHIIRVALAHRSDPRVDFTFGGRFAPGSCFWSRAFPSAVEPRGDVLFVECASVRMRALAFRTRLGLPTYLLIGMTSPASSLQSPPPAKAQKVEHPPLPRGAKPVKEAVHSRPKLWVYDHCPFCVRPRCKKHCTTCNAVASELLVSK